MPDPAHAVLEGLSDGARFLRMVNQWKLRTGFESRRDHGHQLWQRGSYEHVLRTEEDAACAVAYVFMNPVRAGIVTLPGEYQFQGSQTSSIDDWLRRGAEALDGRWTPRWRREGRV